MVPSMGRWYRLLKVARTGITSSLLNMVVPSNLSYSVILCQICLTSEV